MNRKQWIVSLVASGVLAIPVVTFVSALVVFPILFYGVLGLFAVLGWVPLLFAKQLERWWMVPKVVDYTARWQMCLVIWAGCAFGLSRWGDVGSSMGAKNEPYFRMFFAPVRMLTSYLFA